LYKPRKGRYFDLCAKIAANVGLLPTRKKGRLKMANEQHTPGPWRTTRNLNGKLLVASEISGYVPIRTPFREDAFDGPTLPLFVTEAELDANARLFAASVDLLAYAECEEAHRLSLLPSHKGGSGNGQSYMEVFHKHGWDGRDVYGFLDRLRRAAITKAQGEASCPPTPE
jgi:hypothetical protein